MTLICVATILVGFSEPMSKDDTNALKTATNNCSKYFPEAPCLKKFIKREELVYWAICGAKNEKASLSK